MDFSSFYTSTKQVFERVGLKAPLASVWSAGMRMGSRLRTFRQDLDLRMDEIAFARDYDFLNEIGHDADPAKTVLIVSLTDWPAQVKMEGMLAKALQLKGFTPVILTRHGNTRARRYFNVFGYDRYEYFDDVVESVADVGIGADVEKLLEQPLSFSALLDLKYEESYVGRHVLSSIVRKLRHGSVDVSDPRITQMLKDRLPEAMRLVHAAERLIDRVQPQMVLFLDKGYTPTGQIFDVAVNRGIDAIQYCHSQRSDALVLKRYSAENRHRHPFTVSPETWERMRDLPWTEELDSSLMKDLLVGYKEGTWFNRKFASQDKEIKSAAEVKSQVGLHPAKKTAVIFSHVLWDATFFYGENLFDDYEQWLVETVKAACKNTNVNWIVKLHPDYVWKMKMLGESAGPRDLVALGANVGALPRHIHVVEPDTDISTYSFFDITDYCLTVRGTIGIEMPCFGVPVFTAGTGRYSGLGFTHDSDSREDYLAKLGRIHEYPQLTPEQTALARKHAYALFKMRPIPFHTFEQVQMPMDKLGHPLDHNVVIRAHSVRDVREAADLNAFATWASDSSEEDFLRSVPAPAMREQEV